MSRFSLRFPYFIVVLCLMIGVIGVSSIVQMPVDLFPAIRIPVVVVATFYNGMPPEQIENDITGPLRAILYPWQWHRAHRVAVAYRRQLDQGILSAGHERRFRCHDDFQSRHGGPGRLPPGTLPPVVLKSDASSLPVCLVTLKGQGLSETQLRDFGQFAVRNQIASVPGASVPQPFGGKYRQIMVYVDPANLRPTSSASWTWCAR